MDLTEVNSQLLKRQYKDASRLYREASEIFSKQIDKTNNKEINNALKILAEDHLKRSRSIQLSSGSQNVGLSGSTAIQSTNNKLSASLAMARGIPTSSLDNIMGSLEETDGNNSTQILTGNGTGDPIQKLSVQLFNLFKAPKLNTIPEQSEIQVKPTGKSIEELEYENVHLKQLVSNYAENLQIYETTNKKITRNLQVYLSSFKKEMSIKESRKISELERKIDTLQKENKDLTLQKEKLKQRWDELVESAKKRREDQTGTNQ
ncbi:hypothetical protein WICPIJ_005359 [Wickerhamomyces pijperi]|uniref:Uncharacterized protein n=1 Tax=Wickerhamomyces pijperi TaxID=599730 RepID=A0A9P8TM24_WICPI|nr:hypothetical protein WICPIJ_005359 [Wickerhamomyces pijperi]